jgi:hypothetical protein
MSAHQYWMPPVVLARQRGTRPSRRPDPTEQGRPVSGGSASVDEIVAVTRQAGDGRHGRRMRV